MHWPEAWLPGSDPDKEIQPDTSITLLQAWWVGVGFGSGLGDLLLFTVCGAVCCL